MMICLHHVDGTGWDDDAHFRFLHIKKEFQAARGFPVAEPDAAKKFTNP